MMSRICVLSFTLFLTASILQAQGDSRKWMLEVTYNGNTQYFEVSDGNVDSGASLTLSHHETNTERFFQSLQLKYRLADADLVSLEVSLFSGSTNISSPHFHSPIGNYVLHPNESITLSQLNDYGLKTATVKLVTAQPDGLITPTVINKTTSLNVERVDANRSGYKMQVRNLSSSSTKAIAFAVLGPNGTCELHTLNSLLGPAETTVMFFEIPGDRPGWRGPGGETCSVTDSSTPESGHRTPEIVMAAAIFADGTHEGDDSKAVMLDANMTAIETQQNRIDSIVEATFGTAGTNDAMKIGLLESRVGALSEEPSPEIVQSIMARYPTLPDDVSTSIRRDVKSGLGYKKAELLSSLKMFGDQISSGQISNISLRDWWNARKNNCDYNVPSCRASIQSKLLN